MSQPVGARGLGRCRHSDRVSDVVLQEVLADDELTARQGGGAGVTGDLNKALNLVMAGRKELS